MSVYIPKLPEWGRADLAVWPRWHGTCQRCGFTTFVGRRWAHGTATLVEVCGACNWSRLAKSERPT